MGFNGHGKIMDLDALAERLAPLRAARKIVHCHGVFDLLHVGHIRHLQQARQFGDVLVVTLTPDRFVNKGPGRPAFGEQLRAEALAALHCVDFVAINRWPMASDTIRLLKPHFYVKGADYREAQKDVTGGINLEEQAVQSVGGQLAITDDITFSSSSLINRFLSPLPQATQDYLHDFTQRHPIDAIISHLSRPFPLRVLVVGDTIIDQYVYCQALGKSSKEPVLAVQQLSTEQFAGGILAVANHVAGFADDVGLISVLGRKNELTEFIQEKLHPAVAACLLERADSPTIVKRRYIDKYFFQKLFEIYDFNDTPLSGELEDRFCRELAARLPAADLVIVMDFGHGLITRRAVEILCAQAKFLAVNTQSNAGNFGCHTISKYPRADFVCLAENEMRLESRDRHGDLKPMVLNVSERLNCPQVVVTRGSRGCLCYDQGDKAAGFYEVPAVTAHVQDRMGAGDTFMAIASLCAAQGVPMEIMGLIGNAAGAQAVATVGHRRFLERAPLIKHMECLLK